MPSVLPQRSQSTAEVATVQQHERFAADDSSLIVEAGVGSEQEAENNGHEVQEVENEDNAESDEQYIRQRDSQTEDDAWRAALEEPSSGLIQFAGSQFAAQATVPGNMPATRYPVPRLYVEPRSDGSVPVRLEENLTLQGDHQPAYLPRDNQTNSSRNSRLIQGGHNEHTVAPASHHHRDRPSSSLQGPYVPAPRNYDDPHQLEGAWQFR